MRELLTVSEEAACPAAVRPVLLRYLADEISAEVAVMHLLLALRALPPLRRCLQMLAARQRDAFVRLAQLATEHNEGLARVAGLVMAGLTEAEGNDRVAAIREQFDRAVAAAPEAAVALYSLGDPGILDRATAELAALLADWGLLGADREALDIGCGIGRIEQALAARVRYIMGIDVSAAMIEEAKRRCAGLANVAVAVCNGRDLSQFAETSFDLILAVDSFPYLFAMGSEIVDRHMHDVARLLRPGGTLAIFNYSYRGGLATDRADIAAYAGATGLRVQRNGTRDLALWDGMSFLLKAPQRRG
jgi:SAM-dependent methyltransferase